MPLDADILVVGGGPAGAATAILLAARGWRVILVEQHRYPRQKVCGECLPAGSLALLDTLGVGTEIQERAGPALRYVGLLGAESEVIADFPACTTGPYAFGRAIGRDVLDAVLLERARCVGVHVIQPARLRRVRGMPGAFDCEIKRHESPASEWRRAAMLIDAHGSWEAGPDLTAAGHPAKIRPPQHGGDLFGFKASFRGSRLEPGILPVVTFPGGYGGMVVANGGRTTLACCVRRDVLKTCRHIYQGIPAGDAVGAWLSSRNDAIRRVCDQGTQEGSWLSVGPIRPGIRVSDTSDVFRVGNAAGESHPLIGEGVNMALQSAVLLANHLGEKHTVDASDIRRINRRYATEWRAHFAKRLRFAGVYAQAAMRPSVTGTVHALLRQWPGLLTQAARWTGKAHFGHPLKNLGPTA